MKLPGRGTTRVRVLTGPPGGATIVLSHGLAATGRLNWGPSYAALAQHFRVLSIDHRGHGSGLRTNNFALDECADDAVAIADTFGIDQFIPVGYSMGGPIATLARRRHSHRVAGLVLCATAHRFAQPAPMAAARTLLPVVGGMARLVPDQVHRLLLDRSIAALYWVNERPVG